MPYENHGRGRIVVGVDGSTSSVRALRWALRQAELTGAVVEAVYVWDLTTSFGMSMTVSPTENLALAAEEVLAQAIVRAADGGPIVPMEHRVEQGKPAAVLIEEAKRADLLVLGGRGLGGFAGALLGSVSQHCVQHAACPVVVVRTDV
ncbi:universal stress protein [Glycomyces sp. L485]|nr:universal stress protein [Glycomyces sp. L485]MCH7230858.1 universal stress protein [Glycomyces sp. L485]